MIYFLYVLIAIFSRTDSALGKYNGKQNGDSTSFNLSKLASALVVSLFLCIFFGLSLHLPTVLLGTLFGGCLAVATYFGLAALVHGPMAIVSVVASFHLIIPVGYGLIFLDERLSVYGVIGLLLLPVSILMLNLKKTGEKISPFCWLCVFFTFLANGIGAVVQKKHQVLFCGEYKADFMVYGAAAALIFFALFCVCKTKKGSRPPHDAVKAGLLLGALCGVLNCLVNFLTLYLAAAENASVLFPVLSVANAILACIIGRVVFGERLSVIQKISIVIGIVCVLLLKI